MNVAKFTINKWCFNRNGKDYSDSEVTKTILEFWPGFHDIVMRNKEILNFNRLVICCHFLTFSILRVSYHGQGFFKFKSSGFLRSSGSKPL